MTATAEARPQGKSDRHCELAGRLEAFTPLYWWLEYWGDWARHSGPRGMSLLERLAKFGDEFIPPSTASDGFPETIRLLERALGHLRLRDRFHFRVIAALHIGKGSMLEIASLYGIRRRGLERTLWRAYMTLQAEIIAQDRKFFDAPAPIYIET